MHRDNCFLNILFYSFLFTLYPEIHTTIFCLCSFNYIVSFYLWKLFKIFSILLLLSMFPSFLWPHSASLFFPFFSSIIFISYYYDYETFTTKLYNVLCSLFFPCVNFFELTSHPLAWFSLYQLPVLTLSSDRTMNSSQYGEAGNMTHECVCAGWRRCSWSRTPCFSVDFLSLFKC